jgi:hypothetical protein
MPDRERVYLIQCPGMKQADRIILKNMNEFVRMIEQYLSRYSDIDLLYREQ